MPIILTPADRAAIRDAAARLWEQVRETILQALEVQAVSASVVVEHRVWLSHFRRTRNRIHYFANHPAHY